MKESEFLSVGDFAKISRTTLHTLRHYDKIGLLSPIYRAGNNYRYYSIRQLAATNVIRTLQKLGVPLAKIKELREERTPELARDILYQQIDELDAKRERLDQAQRLLHTLLHSIESSIHQSGDDITIQYLPSEPIILGDQNDYSGGKTDYDALSDFYQAMFHKHQFSEYDMNYPVWALFSAERIRCRDWDYPDRFYFYNPAGQDLRPAALYATGYTRTGYGKASALYERMVDYIERHGFEIGGDAYEEYPINEMCTCDDQNYLIRLMITVREKYEVSPATACTAQSAPIY